MSRPAQTSRPGMPSSQTTNTTFVSISPTTPSAFTSQHGSSSSRSYSEQLARTTYEELVQKCPSGRRQVSETRNIFLVRIPGGTVGGGGAPDNSRRQWPRRDLGANR